MCHGYRSVTCPGWIVCQLSHELYWADNLVGENKEVAQNDLFKITLQEVYDTIYA